MIFIWVSLTAVFKPLLSLVTQSGLLATFLCCSASQNGTNGSSLLQPTVNLTSVGYRPDSTSASSQTAVSDLSQSVSPPPLSDWEETGRSGAMVEESHILGTFAYQSSRNFDSYLKELGVSYVLRTFAGMATPVVTISKKCPTQEPLECRWKIYTDTLFKSHEVNFQLGQSGRDVTMDGRAVNFVLHQTGPNTLVEEQTSGGKTTRLVRTFSREGMEVDLSVNNVTSSSTFYRVK
eukprot:maker-scaffold273_size229271-snap-gene-0.9 protein:Tk00744 transcript:maker-scaffold273_size229271-snap-gene-0.9-mRNA-1 annotation:"fatty acid-binding protein"